ncbi:MAG: hypothetical protein K0R63_465 [Rickettsiales bacterium]|jgi:hypothetical protein|nr:hypothetical protein [Rickettsiales bacterium]
MKYLVTVLFALSLSGCSAYVGRQYDTLRLLPASPSSPKQRIIVSAEYSYNGKRLSWRDNSLRSTMQEALEDTGYFTIIKGEEAKTLGGMLPTVRFALNDETSTSEDFWKGALSACTLFIVGNKVTHPYTVDITYIMPDGMPPLNKRYTHSLVTSEGIFVSDPEDVREISRFGSLREMLDDVVKAFILDLQHSFEEPASRGPAAASSL